MIRPATPADYDAILAIWNPVIRDTTIIFANDERTTEGLDSLMAERRAAGREFLVAETADGIVGFASYAQFRGGNGYAHAMEHTVILAPEANGRGIGRALMADIEGKVPNTPTLAGLPDCLALLLAPAVLLAEQPFETLFAQAMWLHTWFGDRAAIASDPRAGGCTHRARRGTDHGLGMFEVLFCIASAIAPPAAMAAATSNTISAVCAVTSPRSSSLTASRSASPARYQACRILTCVSNMMGSPLLWWAATLIRLRGDSVPG